MSEIFLSYCRRDMEFCDKVYEHLSSVCGYSVFMDRVGIEGGTQWEEVLANAIKDCKVMLLLLSQDAHDSPNVDREISFALMRNKAIVPFVIKPDVSFSNRFLLRFSSVQMTSLHELPSDEERLTRIEKAMVARLQERAASRTSQADALRTHVDELNQANEAKLGEVGSRIHVNVQNETSIHFWLTFDIGLFGMGGLVKLVRDGSRIYACSDLNGKYCNAIKLAVQAACANAGLGGKAITQNPAYNIYSFFDFPVPERPFAPRTFDEWTHDLKAITGELFPKVIDAFHPWLKHCRESSEVVKELDKRLLQEFPESEGWIVDKKMTREGIFRAYHADAKSNDQWSGLLDASQPAFLSLQVRSQMLNALHVSISRGNEALQYGELEKEAFATAHAHADGADGQMNAAHVFYQKVKKFERMGLTLNYGEAFIPWTEDRKNEFWTQVVGMLTRLKDPYLRMIERCRQTPPLDFVSPYAPEDGAWGSCDFAAPRIGVARIVQEIVRPMLQTCASKVIRTKVDHNAATIDAVFEHGGIELSARFEARLDGTKYGIAYLNGPENGYRPRLAEWVQLKIPQSLPLARNINSNAVLMYEAVVPVSQRGETSAEQVRVAMETLARTCQSSLPDLLKLLDSIKLSIDSCNSLIGKLRERVQSAFGMIDKKWRAEAACQDIKSPGMGVRLRHPAWKARPDAAFDLSQFAVVACQPFLDDVCVCVEFGGEVRDCFSSNPLARELARVACAKVVQGKALQPVVDELRMGWMLPEPHRHLGLCAMGDEATRDAALEECEKQVLDLRAALEGVFDKVNVHVRSIPSAG